MENEQEFVTRLVERAATEIRSRLTALVADGPWEPKLQPLYVSFLMPENTTFEAAANEYVEPGAMALARAINGLGKSVRLQNTPMPTKGSGVVSHVVEGSDIPVRGILSYDGVLQSYRLTFVIYAEADE